MVLTKQTQERLIDEFLSTHSVIETQAFIKGMEAIIEVINNNEDPRQTFVGC
jgi:hypothetical protein